MNILELEMMSTTKQFIKIWYFFKFIVQDEIPFQYDATFDKTLNFTGEKEVILKKISNYRKFFKLACTITSLGQFLPGTGNI